MCQKKKFQIRNMTHKTTHNIALLFYFLMISQSFLKPQPH